MTPAAADATAGVSMPGSATLLGMASYEDLQRLALELPGVSLEGLELRLDGGGLTWPWRERVDPRKPKVPNLGVAVLPVADEQRKDELIATEPELFFTEPHYDGYAAVLLRLEAVPLDRLEAAVREAWDVRTAKNARRRRRS